MAEIARCTWILPRVQSLQKHGLNGVLSDMESDMLAKPCVVCSAQVWPGPEYPRLIDFGLAFVAGDFADPGRSGRFPVLNGQPGHRGSPENAG